MIHNIFQFFGMLMRRSTTRRVAVFSMIVAVAASFVACDLLVSNKNKNLPFKPAAITISDDSPPLRIVVLGDFGRGGDGQRDVAAAIAKVHAERPLNFGITVGDNFYEHGVTSVTDKKWQSRWEEPYASLGIPFYPTLGNHDYYGNVQAQLDYVSASKTWRFPARQYLLSSGLVDLIAIDTMDPSPEQSEWLDQQIAKSRAKWLIVYGHHPIYSAGHHGDNKEMEATLLPLLRGRVPLYVAGHDHDLQYLKPIDGTHLVISGGGGAKLRQLKPDPRAIFARTVYGFTTLEVSPERILVEMYDSKANRIFTTDIPESESLSKHRLDNDAEAVPSVPERQGSPSN